MMGTWDAGPGTSACDGCGSSKSMGCGCCPFIVSAAGFTKMGEGGCHNLLYPPGPLCSGLMRMPHSEFTQLTLSKIHDLSQCFPFLFVGAWAPSRAIHTKIPSSSCAMHSRLSDALNHCGYTGSPPATTSLFSFSVTDLAGRCFQVTRSAFEFERLHKRLCEYGQVRKPSVQWLGFRDKASAMAPSMICNASASLILQHCISLPFPLPFSTDNSRPCRRANSPNCPAKS